MRSRSGIVRVKEQMYFYDCSGPDIISDNGCWHVVIREATAGAARTKLYEHMVANGRPELVASDLHFSIRRRPVVDTDPHVAFSNVERRTI